MSEIFLSKPGVACAAGISAEELWNSVTDGNQGGIKKIVSYSGKEFFAARLNDSLLKKSSARYDMRIFQIAEIALNQIAADVQKAKEKFGAGRIAVCVGSCDNGTEFSFAAHKKFFDGGNFPEGYSLEIQGADFAATFVSEKFSLGGVSLAFSTACSSGACAIIKAAQLLECGAADAVVAGGMDIASDTVLLGFDSLEAVSPQITNPFSRNRRGITLGEGASFFVMTREKISGNSVRLLGWGESSDAHHMTSPDPSGEGASRAMEAALKNAGISADEIDYVNLHGTGTKLNDSMESSAMKKIFGENSVPASSTKPLTGHTLGAAGALEAAVCFMAIEKNSFAENSVLPVHVWDGESDGETAGVNLVQKNQRFGRIKKCMTNSFAFGGSNASLILGAAE